MKINKITARRVLDSRGRPTVEATVYCENGLFASASVPSGASAGSHEAIELRDGGKPYGGLDVSNAIFNVNHEISSLLSGFSVYDQTLADAAMAELDGTPDKSRLGANAILAVSEAIARTAAFSLGIPLFLYIGGISGSTLPLPMMNILNGGAHASNNADIQEFMIVPTQNSFSDRLRAGAEIYYALGGLLKEKEYGASVGDEGGYAPSLRDDREAVELIIQAIERAGYNTETVGIAIDAAANEWRDENGFTLQKSGRKFSTEKLFDYFVSLAYDYKLVSIEDPFGEDDFDAYAELTGRLSGKTLVVGDDLYVTDKKRLLTGINRRSTSAILIKPNQVGTLSETMAAVRIAKANGLKVIISHRSGETDDDFISDLSVALNAGLIKAGAPCRGERTAKYNRLTAIENILLRGNGISGKNYR